VVVTPPTERDRDEFLAAVAASGALHGRWVTAPSTPEHYSLYVRRCRREDHEGFLVRERATGALAGVVNVNNIVRAGMESATLGYYAFTPYAGRGYMREGLALVLSHAFSALHLHRLEANIQPGNEPSLRLVASLGFRREGFSPQYLKIQGEWRDHERWAILAHEWRA
jgi:ribosomal-protein-alanine N-acetyltransferase